MFCFMSHLVEDCYFEEIEFFFLIVGHTHNILDQWFGVLSRAIRGASFIGSYLALHELYKIAHSEEEADQRPQKVHQLELYHDWRRFYNAVRNTDIHNYGLPHRFKITLDPLLKVAKMQYMVMSPTAGLKYLEKWQPVPNAAALKTGTVDGDIQLSPLIVFNGPEVVLKALGTSGKINFTELAVGDDKARSKASDMSFIMPILRQIEVRAIGESTIRLEQEAECGDSEERINIPTALLKKIESEITRNNSSAGGRIVWLRRSKCSEDPDYLNRRPDILPNPRLWNERIAKAPKTSPPEESSDRSTPQPKAKLSAEEVAMNKILTAEANESQQRFIQFQKGASEIALTATHVLKLLEVHKEVGGLSLATHNNIIEATKNFSKSVLTPREVTWYQSMSSARSITSRVEAMVEYAKQQPWALLNLPVETPQQKAHRDALLIARKVRVAQVEANLRKLVMREGEGEYNPDLQVVSMDGFVPAQTRDVDKMNRPQLEALAKGHMKTKEMKALKVDQLRAEVKKLVEKFPNLLQVPSAQPTNQADTEQVAGTLASVGEEVNPETDEPPPIPMDILTEKDEVICCSVLECDSSAPELTVLCEECNLHFCTEMHALHSSHSQQYLLPGRTAKRSSIEDSKEQPIEEFKEQPAAESVTATNAASALSSPNKRQKKNPTTAATSTAEIGASLVIPMRSIDDNPAARRSWELEKLKNAVIFIRQELNKGEVDHKIMLYSKFNYPSCYDITFFQALASEFNIDVSHMMSKKRVQLKDVLVFIINKLVV